MEFNFELKIFELEIKQALLNFALHLYDSLKFLNSS